MRQYLLGIFFVLLAQSLWASSTLLPDTKSAYLAIQSTTEVKAWQIPTGSSKPIQNVDVRKLNTPLGSVWKLFVYAYLTENKITAPDYQCTGQNPEQEKYCCTQGASINQEEALIQSCGLFFEPRRLGINQSQWQTFWYTQKAPIWLQQLTHAREDYTLSVQDLLDALLVYPADAKEQASISLLNLWLKETNEETLASIGTQIRAKTYTMPNPVLPQERIGGFAGWLANGDAIWFGGRGNSMAVLSQTGTMIKPILDTLDSQLQNDSTCVDVNYFAFNRNPIRKITTLSGKQVYGGALKKGRYQVHFVRSKPVIIESDDDLNVRSVSASRYTLTGKMKFSEYIARVIDREASTEPKQAAKALAIAIRTYTLQEASGAENCLLMNDSTLQQRVAPRPASKIARTIVLQTDRLILSDSGGQYQLHTTQKNQLSWQHATQEDKQGLTFRQILSRAYPQASIVVSGSQLSAGCTDIPSAHAWLTKQHKKWLPVLRRQGGFKVLAQAPSLCQLKRGLPYADVSANRIYIRQFKTLNDQVTLAHEYLHLSFANHPNGQDERFVEQLASTLTSGQHYE